VLNWVPDGCLGKSMVFTGLPGKPAFTVVGTASSLDGSADGWVTAAGFARLTDAGASPDAQMLYRFAANGTDAAMAADRDAIAHAAPAGALLGSSTWLRAKQEAIGNTQVFIPFLLVFGILGLFLSVLIIAIVVSGAVVSSMRRIGILKSLGFTPRQVTRAYVMQALVPAVIGVGLGAGLGNLASGPVLHGGDHSLGLGGAAIPWWVNLVVPLGTLALVAATAAVPALRAGRLRAVEALVVGRTPHAERGRAAQRLASRLPLPRAMSLGLAQPFARPTRTALVAGAVVFGAVSATFAVGLESAFAKFQGIRQQGLAHGDIAVRSDIELDGPPADPSQVPRLDPAKVSAVLAAQPGTAGFFGFGETRAVVPGATSDARLDVVFGDLTSKYYLLSGRWFSAPGEAVVPDRLAHQSGISVGDVLTVKDGGHAVALKVVGIDFDVHQSGTMVLTSAATYTAQGLTPPVDEFHVDLKPGVSTQDYMATVNNALNPLQARAEPAFGSSGSDVVKLMSAMVAMLTVMLVSVAALGVLNTVVQDTREKVHDLGVLKALGMTPRQTVTLVAASVTLTGLVAGVIGVPVGIAVEHAVLGPMQRTVEMHLPSEVTSVYSAGVVLPLLAGGVVIALLGALLPAVWAARTRTATALRTE
jgi:putative ABC transport system permease protein